MKNMHFSSSWFLFLFSIATLVLHVVTANDTTTNNVKSTTANSPQHGQFTLSRSIVTARAFQSESQHSPYHEPLAKLFMIESLMDTVKEMHGNIERNQVVEPVARHMIIEKMMHDTMIHSNKGLNGPKQVIIFGAGFDTRANRFANILPVQKWFEIDLPEPQQFKVETLEKHQISDPDNLIRISANLTDPMDSWYDKLVDAGWDSSAPTIFILEGLIYYLTTEEVHNLLSSIPDVPNSKIILTIIDKSLYKLSLKYGGNRFNWKTNLKELNKAGVLKFRNYRLKRSIGTSNPKQIGLNVRVKKMFSPSVSVWDRIKYFFHYPLEMVMEFEAV